MGTSFAGFVEDIRLIDHHVHGAYGVDGDETRFQNSLNEANSEPLAVPSAAYDSQLGFAFRRWCAEIIDLPRHVSPELYWRRRSELGELEISRRMTRAAGVSHWLIDAGFNTGAMLDPPGMAETAGATVREIVRLETLAETLIQSGQEPGDYVEAFTALLASRPRIVVGAKSVLAYRAGFNHDLSRPADRKVAESAKRWRQRIESGGPVRLDDLTLIRFGLHCAISLGLPLQLHVGFGDRELDLDRANPLLLLDFLRSIQASRVPVLLLHCYPFEREAGYLAQAFDNVYFDVGLAVNHVGVRSRSLIARSFELAPFTKILYSSDAIGPAELHYLGARLWRNAIAAIFGQWIDDDEWSDADARRVVELVARENARRVYGLP
ncbi:amidohydrolase family protein [Arthrobacter sp. 9MFCol3.1]|uniref:amidohydrolase family protein n=1 Tax=Arthrobacter sp. 9MFCol3.1 TaxID=1150398 RepID=UPI00047D3B2E|nr:amidohydrolase family protein [Arthrobacter sp. 9MFCol3.1]